MKCVLCNKSFHEENGVDVTAICGEGISLRRVCATCGPKVDKYFLGERNESNLRILMWLHFKLCDVCENIAS